MSKLVLGSAAMFMIVLMTKTTFQSLRPRPVMNPKQILLLRGVKRRKAKLTNRRKIGYTT
ncbi:ribosome biogenesis regulatory protein homolog [Phtheirospermum japonicum]|uniref:Ribosome biogenesis regulatory protein homolog n=1 Tax=Phtheirospermum japonicum TaxID=374723 RepID=A0A830CAA0_9LAMI|nr:ribosome biogenesis regulatory protein homolog [Phtheirospermum japonicum]